MSSEQPHGYRGRESNLLDVDGHGPNEIGYYGGPGEPYFQPSIGCLCGWSTGRHESFEAAGLNFDLHMKGLV